MKNARIKPTLSLGRIAGIVAAMSGVAYILSLLFHSAMPDIVRAIGMLCLGLAFAIAAMSAEQVMGPFPHLVSFEQKKNAEIISDWIILGKISITFIAFIIAYWGLIGSGFSYQPVSYNTLNQPVLFVPSVSQSWEIAVKLGFSVWMIAAILALVMGILKTMTVNGVTKVFNLSEKPQNLGWLMDGIVLCCMLAIPAIIIATAVLESVRSVLSLFEVTQPIYPQITSSLVAVALFASYFIFNIKKRLQNFAKKPVSVSAIFLRQSLFIFIAVLVGNILLRIFPQEMIEPLAQPIRNFFYRADMNNMGVVMLAGLGLASTPVLGAYLAKICEGLAIRKTAGMLLIPLLLAYGVFEVISGATGHGFNFWTPLANLALVAPITEQNILFQAFHGTQLGILCTIMIMFFAFSDKTQLQEAMLGLVPQHIGRRLNRERFLFARVTVLFVVITAGYISVGLPAFYYPITYVFWLVMFGVSIMVFSGFMYKCRHKAVMNKQF